MATSARVGEIIAGKYRVEQVLGEGGMGVVVAARHLRLGERFAIKFPAARLGNHADIVERLTREARAAMRIRSEHVAKVYDVGVLDSGEPYLLMEYLVGQDLAAILAARGPFEITVALEYVLQAIEALAEAHARSIIHRDLKPSNLFLTHRADGSPALKVIDFGVSKLTNGEDATLTASVAMLGSPAYMAPEQMRSAHACDARSDVWALGATLYALLTGGPPFLGGTPIEIHERILAGAPRLRARRADAPTALEEILVRCLQLDPALRYQNVAELARDLAPLAEPHARVSAERAARTLEEDLKSSGPLRVAEPLPAPDAEPPAASSLATRSALDGSWLNGGDTSKVSAVLTLSGTPGRAATAHGRLKVGLSALLGVVLLAAATLLTWRVSLRPRPSVDAPSGDASASVALASASVVTPPGSARAPAATTDGAEASSIAPAAGAADKASPLLAAASPKRGAPVRAAPRAPSPRKPSKRDPLADAD